MNKECTWVEVSWDGLIPALQSQKVDAILASMSITEDRMKAIDFSDKYYQTTALLIAPKSSDITTDPASMEGKVIGVQVATTHRNYAEAHSAETADTIKLYQSGDERNQDLVSGRIDAMIENNLPMADFLRTDGGQCCEIKGELVDNAIYGPGIGAGIRKGDTELQAKLNAAITQIRDDGTYDRISAAYFDFDIIGN